MDMPDWFNERSFGGKSPFGIHPPPMMQQPQVNSQPTAMGSPVGVDGRVYDPQSAYVPQMLAQSPPSLGAQTGFTQTPMPPHRPSQSILDQLQGLQSPAGGLAGPMNPAHPPLPTNAEWAASGAKPAEGGREIGPGSWMDKMAVFDKGSLMGSLFGYRNAKPAPGMPQGSESMGMLPLLYRNFLG